MGLRPTCNCALRRCVLKRCSTWRYQPGHLVRGTEAAGAGRVYCGSAYRGVRHHQRDKAPDTLGVIAGGGERSALRTLPIAASLSPRTDQYPASSYSIRQWRGVPMRYLSTVYVRDHQARVKHRRGSLVVSSPEGNQRIPLEAIDSLVMLGAAQVTSQALEQCVRRGVRVTALRMGGSVRYIVGGPTGGNVHLRTALYRTVVDEGRSLALSKAIVAAKLQNSRKVVDRWGARRKTPRGCARAGRARGADSEPGPTPCRCNVLGPGARDRGRRGQNLLWRNRAGTIEQRSRILRESPATASGSGQCNARILLRPVGDRADRGH